MMKWLKRYLLLIVVLFVFTTNARAAESVQVSVPQTLGPEYSEARTSLKAVIGAPGITLWTDQTSA